MKSDLFANTFGKRLRIARKIVFGKNPYLIITRKPPNLVQPRPSDHVIGPVAEAIHRHRETIDSFRETLAPFISEWSQTPESSAFFEGPVHFEKIDSACAYAMVRHFQPRLIIEIGCGQSTHVMRKASNESVTHGAAATRIICIDPAPRKNIEGVADEISYTSVLDAEPDVFDRLGSGDFLFIDGSHYAFNGTDVTYLFLEVLPRLSCGVIVHVHDIFLPYEYPPEFTRRLYNEQYVLAALTMDTSSWEVLLPVYAESQAGRLGDGGHGGSFWLRKL